MMLKILAQYKAPPKLCLAITRMYIDLKGVLNIGKVEKAMGQTVPIQQEDCMALVLFSEQ